MNIFMVIENSGNFTFGNIIKRLKLKAIEKVREFHSSEGLAMGDFVIKY